MIEIYYFLWLINEYYIHILQKTIATKGIDKDAVVVGRGLRMENIMPTAGLEPTFLPL